MLAATASLLMAAALACAWPVLSGLFLLSALGCGMATLFVFPPAGLDGPADRSRRPS